MTLYHGTSTWRWVSIQRDGWLKCAPYGDQHVSLTDTPSVARYFADLAADCDGCAAIVLAVDASGLPTEPFVSQCWEGCEWERETACLADVPAERCRAECPAIAAS